MRKAVLPALTLLLTLTLASPALAAPKWSVRSLRGDYLCMGSGTERDVQFSWTGQLSLDGQGRADLDYFILRPGYDGGEDSLLDAPYYVSPSGVVEFDWDDEHLVAAGKLVQGGRGIMLQVGMTYTGFYWFVAHCWRDR